MSLDPPVNYGQIVEGCEVYISPKEFERSVAQLPSSASAIFSRSLDVSLDPLDDNKDSEGFLLQSFVNYFKGKKEKKDQELDFLHHKSVFRVVPTQQSLGKGYF